MAKRSRTHVPKFASKKRRRKLKRVAKLDLLSPEALAGAADLTESIRKREASSMQRLLNSMQPGDGSIRINCRA